MHYTLHYEANPRAEDIQLLNDGLAENTRQKRDMLPLDFFAFFIKDEKNQIVGGCAGDNMYGCLYVGQLWIKETLRGQGYGTHLMQETETLAKKHQCHFMAVNTFDWEALDFYKKMGFYVEFERHGFHKDAIFYFLRKDLK